MMKRYVAVFAVLAGLLLPAGVSSATSEIGEGYARPTFPELIQTLIMLNGYDINNSKVADEYGHIVYCDLYEKNFGNDAVWNRIRGDMVARVQKKKEYFRVKYEIVSAFNLGRYDFKNQFFPISDKSALMNVGYIDLFAPEDHKVDCSGRDLRSLFPVEVVLNLNEPLTINGFSVPQDKVEKMMVRIEEAGDVNRLVYGRIRVLVTSADKGTIVSRDSGQQSTLRGRVIAVDFFLDPDLTKPIGSIKVSHEAVVAH